MSNKITVKYCMVNLDRYPNPVRLFTSTRNQWFTDFVESLNIPIHVFTNIRDTQLGQLFFAIEIMRQKKIRQGEEPGKPLFEGDNSEAFVPLFQTFKQLEDFFAKDEVNAEFKDLKTEFLNHESIKSLKKIAKTPDEWFSTLELTRLDELFVPAAKLFTEVILGKIDEVVENKDAEDVFDKISEIDPNMTLTLRNLLDPAIIEAINNNSYTIDEENTSIRVIKTSDEENPIKLDYNDYHSRVNVLYSLILELTRYFEKGKNYTRSFEFIPHLITIEMLIMIPQADKARINLVKNNLKDMAELKNGILDEFWEIISLNYQGYCHVNDPSQRMFQKLFKSMQKSLKQESRAFWRKIQPKLMSDDKKERAMAEELVAVLWSHFRVVQAQAQAQHQQEHQDHDHQNYTSRAMLRFEHIFWQQASQYLNVDEFVSKYHFWAAYAKIANKEVRSPKDSIALFKDFVELFAKTKILSNKTKRKLFDISLRDQKSIVQGLVSYGVEGRDGSVYPQVEKYVDMLEKIIKEIEADIDSFEDINLEEERKTITSIREYLKIPVEAPKEAPKRQLRRLRN